MIQLWSWPTPNGQKVHIALEELGLPYTVVPVDIGKGAQFSPEFLAITPNHRIPAIVDADAAGGPLTLFESGAILVYLADKTGKLLAKEGHARWTALQWVMFQMSAVGPNFGQQSHFAKYAPEKLPYAIERFDKEIRRILSVLDKRLAAAPYLAGEEYSIADIATFPWTRGAARRGVDMSELPNVARWHATIAARPAVARGLAVLKDDEQQTDLTPEQRENLFGVRQFQRR